MSVHLLGIRHHGPGSARSVLAALESIRPQVVLIEGPPDADEWIGLAAQEEMRPPVALLVYRPDSPKQAVFYPFAEFSPEWQALRWALANRVPVRFMDLPQRHRLAIEEKERAAFEAKEDMGQPEEAEAGGGEVPDDEAGKNEPAKDAPMDIRDQEADEWRDDPLGRIAKLAGYTDSERWWEEQFERRHSGAETFAAVLEMMTALREGLALSPMEALREAWMRQTLREAIKQGHERIAVICGAWHGPALAALPSAKSDADLLRGLPKVAVAATWLPWTHRRLTRASGYGAGVHSPGYYAHLWSVPPSGGLAMHWMTQVAHLLRAEDLESSTASIIEATRLAETLAGLRGCAVPGLAEFEEAAQAVFCFGDRAPMALIQSRLVVGDRLGAVTAEAPQVPLQRDFQKETKRLRLPPEALERTLELDLRKAGDLERSRLLHRLRLLRVEWGSPVSARGKGTFKEAWKLRWDPELEVALIEQAPWGNTIVQAATQSTIDRALKSTSLPELTRLVDTLLLAELAEAIERVMQRLKDQAAVTSDLGHLMEALPPLAAVLRYGNVRQTDASMVAQIVDGLVARICVGLHPACASLSDESAMETRTHLDATDTALATLAEAALLRPWRAALYELAEDDGLHGLLSGRATRLLLEAGEMDAAGAGRQLGRHLSRANAPAQAAAWLEGFLAGSGLVLIHQAALWRLLDAWLGALSADHFAEVLPLLRRTFATFAPPERRQMGELAKRGDGGDGSLATPKTAATDDIEISRANRVLGTLALLLGAESGEVKTQSAAKDLHQ